jgi:hypothetical protein
MQAVEVADAIDPEQDGLAVMMNCLLRFDSARVQGKRFV